MELSAQPARAVSAKADNHATHVYRGMAIELLREHSTKSHGEIEAGRFSLKWGALPSLLGQVGRMLTRFWGGGKANSMLNLGCLILPLQLFPTPCRFLRPSPT